MGDPWVLASTSGNNVVLNGMDFSELYYTWVAKSYLRFDQLVCLCNWFPLTVLIEFAAEKGVRVRLNCWPGQAPVNGGNRVWDVTRTVVLDSHGGDFASKADFLSQAKAKVTARMIGTLNSVAIEQVKARPGDLVSHDYRDAYWHVELITKVSGGVITTESGSVPARPPRDHSNNYDDLSRELKIYQNKPRRWQFEAVLSS